MYHFRTRVEGSGKVVGVYIYDDSITNTEKQLGVAITGDSGKFSIVIDIQTISWYLSVAIIFMDSFSHPGKETETYLPPHEPEVHQQRSDEVPITVWTIGFN